MTLSRRATFGFAAALLPLPVLAGANLIPVTLAISSSSLAYGGLRMAEFAGLFQKNGVQPRIIVSESGNAAITAMLSGSADLSGAGPSEVLAARVRGQQVLLFVNLYHGLAGSLVLSRATTAKLGDAAKGDVEQRVKALNGLTIAEPSATSAYMHPIRGAAEAQHADIHFVYMTQPAMVAALQAGVIDGFVAGAPFSLAPISNGSGVMWINGPKADLPAPLLPSSSACLQTTEAYAKAHPDIVRRLFAVFADLRAFVQDHPADAQAALAKGYPQLDLATIGAVFAAEAPNWTHPVFTVADIRQEIAIQVSSGALHGLEKIDPASLLLQPPV
jgi:ABC-type nitrate/sulfonate/bicarbonate transport system substrate-binding protein